MALSVRLDAKTESLIGRLARKRRQTKSEVIRDAVGVLAKEDNHGSDGKRPYDRVAHLVGCVKGGPRNLSARSGERFLQMLLDRRRSR